MYLQEKLHGGGGFSSVEWKTYNQSQNIWD